MKRKYFTDAIRQDMVSNQNILHKAVYDEDREIAYFAVSLMTAKLQALSNELFHLEQKHQGLRLPHHKEGFPAQE